MDETDTVPKTFIGPGNKRLAHPNGGTEPMGNRIIEIPEDVLKFYARKYQEEADH